jgi:hypothetical protein
MNIINVLTLESLGFLKITWINSDKNENYLTKKWSHPYGFALLAGMFAPTEIYSVEIILEESTKERSSLQLTMKSGVDDVIKYVIDKTLQQRSSLNPDVIKTYHALSATFIFYVLSKNDIRQEELRKYMLANLTNPDFAYFISEFISNLAKSEIVQFKGSKCRIIIQPVLHSLIHSQPIETVTKIEKNLKFYMNDMDVPGFKVDDEASLSNFLDATSSDFVTYVQEIEQYVPELMHRLAVYTRTWDEEDMFNFNNLKPVVFRYNDDLFGLTTPSIGSLDTSPHLGFMYEVVTGSTNSLYYRDGMATMKRPDVACVKPIDYSYVDFSVLSTPKMMYEPYKFRIVEASSIPGILISSGVSLPNDILYVPEILSNRLFPHIFLTQDIREDRDHVVRTVVNSSLYKLKVELIAKGILSEDEVSAIAPNLPFDVLRSIQSEFNFYEVRANSLHYWLTI